MFKTAAFSLFCLLFSSLVCYQFSTLSSPYRTGSSSIKELLIYGGQFLIQALILSCLAKQNSIAYIVVIFLVCLLTVNFFWGIPSFYYLMYFGLVVFTMIGENKKNVPMLCLPKLLNLNWIFIPHSGFQL
jgi:hypothetical protein